VRCDARAAFCWAVQQDDPSAAFEGKAMASKFEPPLGEMSWLRGRDYPARVVTARLLLLPVLLMVGSMTWILLPGPSGAESQPLPARSPVLTSAQDPAWFDPAITRIQATTTMTPSQTNLVTPADTAPPAEAAPPEAAPAELAPVDGLKIASQSWRRGGLGSKALVTLTLRNANYYPVKDIEIFCSFARRDGSHLTDRKRVIPDIVNMKSRKTFARLHVGFVNVNAERAKCSLVTASRI
jgi:hypothetical protein